METLFTLCGARTGTTYLADFVRSQGQAVKVFHEPYEDPANPPMFGPAILARAMGNEALIRQWLEHKRRRVESYSTEYYVEISHAFLKSWWGLARDYFPGLKVIQLIRHPLETALSEANREAYIVEKGLDGCHYDAGSGRRLYRWSLSGLEPLFRNFDLQKLTLFQRYLIQWIEVENRAMRFLDESEGEVPCVTFHAFQDFEKPEEMKARLASLGLRWRASSTGEPLKQNRTPGRPTELGEREWIEAEEVLSKLPRRSLELLERDPYREATWMPELLRRLGGALESTPD